MRPPQCAPSRQHVLAVVVVVVDVGRGLVPELGRGGCRWTTRPSGAIETSTASPLWTSVTDPRNKTTVNVLKQGEGGGGGGGDGGRWLVLVVEVEEKEEGEVEEEEGGVFGAGRGSVRASYVCDQEVTGRGVLVCVLGGGGGKEGGYILRYACARIWVC